MIVLGFHKSKYFRLHPWLAHCLNKWMPYHNLKISTVTNPEPERGQFSSLQCGLNWLKGQKHKSIFVLPIDVPIPSKPVWDQLLSHLRGRISVCQPFYNGRGGHPVLLSQKFANHIAFLPLTASDARLDRQIQMIKASQLSKVVVSDPLIHFNLNTRGAMEKFLNNRFRI